MSLATHWLLAFGADAMRSALRVPAASRFRLGERLGADGLVEVFLTGLAARGPVRA